MQENFKLSALSLALSLALFSPVGHAASYCKISPSVVVVAEGESVNLQAVCMNGVDAYPVSAISWQMAKKTINGVGNYNDLTGTLTVSPPSNTLQFSTPINLTASATGETYYFRLYDDSQSLSDGDLAAQVIVMPVATLQADVSAPSMKPDAKINGQCASTFDSGGAVTVLPTGLGACITGKQSLIISNPTGYTWTCASTNGGSDASCYATKGYTVSTNAVNNGQCAGSISQALSVSSGAPAAVSANPGSCVTTFTSNCGGTATGNNFSIPSVGGNCQVTATFNAPPAAYDGACPSGLPTRSASAPTPSCSSANLPSALDTSDYRYYKWTCPGTSGRSTATCSVIRTYTVTSTDNGSANGDVGPASQEVDGGGTATFTASNVTSGYSTSFSSGCGGSGSGGSFTTGAVSGNCTVTATFNQTPTNTCGASNATAIDWANYGKAGYSTKFDISSGAILSLRFVHNGNASGAFVWSGVGPLTGSISACPGKYPSDIPGASGFCSPRYAQNDGSVYYANSSANGCGLTTGTEYYFNLRAGTNSVPGVAITYR